MEQITISNYMHNLFFDRNGKTRQAPEWVEEERCGNCEYWQLLPEYDQPPNGWGIRGLCGSHQCQNQFTTSQTSYCQEFKRGEWA